MYFIQIVLIPSLIGIGCFVAFRGKIAWQIAAGIQAVLLVILGIGTFIAQSPPVHDIEFLNGHVIGKARTQVSCSHDYKCNCYTTESTDSQGHTTSEEHCSTCYEHSYDVDWDVSLSTGSSFDISRIDRQGLDMPPRWGSVYVNEPSVEEHWYDNYVKAAPSTLFRISSVPETELKRVPGYPRMYDYYRAQKFLTEGVGVPGSNSWEWLIEQINSKWGAQKQVNVLVLVAKEAPSFEYAVQHAWLGGKKNDLILLIGSSNGHTIDWVRVITYSTATDMKVELRDDVQTIGSLDRRDAIAAAIEKHLPQFQRHHMKDFKYLLAEYQPPHAWTVGLIIFGIALSLGLNIYFLTNGSFID